MNNTFRYFARLITFIQKGMNDFEYTDIWNHKVF